MQAAAAGPGGGGAGVGGTRTSDTEAGGAGPVRLRVGQQVADSPWHVVRRLGEGGCGVVYEVKRFDQQGQTVPPAALKVEPKQKNKVDEILKIEVHILRQLNAAKARHCCRLILCGAYGTYNYVVMTLLGENLGDLRRAMPQSRFTLSSALRLARGTLAAIGELHAIGFVHRDIKPTNFAMGLPPYQRNIVMLDYGLARCYATRDKAGKWKVRTARGDVPFRGTLRYCSTNVHRRKEQGQCDDVISWCYMIVEMLTGRLPWTHGSRELVANSKAEYDRKAEKLFTAECGKAAAVLRPHWLKLVALRYGEPAACREIGVAITRILHEDGVDSAEPFDWQPGGRHHDAYRKSKEELTASERSEDERHSREPSTSGDTTVLTDAPHDVTGAPHDVTGAPQTQPAQAHGQGAVTKL